LLESLAKGEFIIFIFLGKIRVQYSELSDKPKMEDFDFELLEIEELARRKEIKQRQDAVDSSVASFALEGVYATKEFMDLANRYIHLEIDRDQFVELAHDLK
jgi:hypothetical protein